MKAMASTNSFHSLLNAVSFTGAISHPYKAFGIIFVLMIFALLLYDVDFFSSLPVAAAAFLILVVSVVPYHLWLVLLKCAPRSLMSLRTTTVEPNLPHLCLFSHTLLFQSGEKTTDFFGAILAPMSYRCLWVASKAYSK